MKTAHEAGQRKAPAPEMCKLIGHYAEAEAKLLKFIEDNGAWCGMPPQLAEQVKAGQAKTIAARERICAMVSPSKREYDIDLLGPRLFDPAPDPMKVRRRIRIAAFSPDLMGYKCGLN